MIFLKISSSLQKPITLLPMPNFATNRLIQRSRNPGQLKNLLQAEDLCLVGQERFRAAKLNQMKSRRLRYVDKTSDPGLI